MPEAEKQMSISVDALRSFRTPVALLNDIKLRGRRWHFAHYVATLGAGTAIGQCFSVALAPIITRLYTPADLGALGLFTTFLGVAAVGTSLKYELGVVSAADETEAGQLTWASVMFCLPMSLLAGGILYLLIQNKWFGFGALPKYAIALMVPTVLLAGLFAALRYWAIRQERFGLISRSTITQGATRSLSQAGLGILAIGASGLFWGELVGRALAVVSMLKQSLPGLRLYGIRAEPRQLACALKRNSKLPVYSLPSSLIDNIAAGAALPLLVQLYGTHAGGQFALVQKVCAVPLALISASVADAFHNRIALCARDTPERTRALFNRTSAVLLLMGLAPALALVFAGNCLFGFVFGNAWAAAGTLAAISAPWFLAQFVVSPLSRLVFVLHGQEAKLIYDVALLLGIFGTYEFALSRHLTLVRTVAALTIVNTLAYFLYYLVLLHIVSKSTPRLVGQT
jgi:lipopolysaccharide exporter